MLLPVFTESNEFQSDPKIRQSSNDMAARFQLIVTLSTRQNALQTIQRERELIRGQILTILFCDIFGTHKKVAGKRE